MKTLLRFALFCSLALLTGCAINAGSAKEYHRTTTVIAVTSTTDLTGIAATEEKITAADAKFTLTFPGFLWEQRAKDLVLKRPPVEKP